MSDKKSPFENNFNQNAINDNKNDNIKRENNTMSSELSSVFRIEKRENGIVVVTMDTPNSSQNTLKLEFSNDVESLLKNLEHDNTIRGMVFTSGKKDCFIAGADISLFKSISTKNDAIMASKRGQDIFNKLSNMPFPVVSAIQGACMGGGLEFALACTSRICANDKKTELSLPEVQIGLMPGAGGTQRLPRLVGLAVALDIMLTGRKIRPQKALKIGLVDSIVEPSILLETAIKKAIELSNNKPAIQLKEEKHGWEAITGSIRGALKELTKKDGVQNLLLEDNMLGRKILFQQARKTLKKKTLGNYPAPEKIIDAVEIGIEKGFEEGLLAESKFFGEMVVSPQSKQLINIFFATVALKKDTGVDLEVDNTSDNTADIDGNASVDRSSQDTVSENTARKTHLKEISSVAILGAGLMGAGIAYTSSALAGSKVRLKDKDDLSVLRGMKAVKSIYDTKIKRKSMPKSVADLLYSHVTGTTDYTGFASSDIVIEAVFENLALKHQIIKEVEGITKPSTIIASNTSSIPITKLAEASVRPENFIGLHYFSPVDKMPLLEIIVTKKTSAEVTKRCVQFGKKQGKTVIVVRDGVGFYTSRILAPYMNEAAYLLSESVAIDTIDEALKKWGYPVGPMTLLDEVGIDVAEKVGHIMIDAFGQRMEPPMVMQRLVEDGRMGRKNKKGLYSYTSDKKGKKEVDERVYSLLDIHPTKNVDTIELAERCAYQMINEAIRCYQDGILRSPRDGDIGAIFGLGFPPFRGGPFRYVDEIGVSNFLAKLKHFQLKYGARFTPASILFKMAESNELFHKD